MGEGEIDEAVSLYDRGIELAEKGAEFHVFLLVLKCCAYAAADERALLAKTLASLYAADPAVRMKVGLLFAPALPAMLDPERAAQMSGSGIETAGARLSYIHNISARHFRQEAHRANLLRGPTSQIIRRFGADALPRRQARSHWPCPYPPSRHR